MPLDPPSLTEPARDTDVRRVSRLRWLLLLPFVATLWVPFYNGVDPTFFSIPRFYWYQLLWVLLCGAIVGLVYVVEHRDR